MQATVPLLTRRASCLSATKVRRRLGRRRTLRHQGLQLMQPTPEPQGLGPHKVHRFRQPRRPSGRDGDGRLQPTPDQVPPSIAATLKACAVGRREGEEPCAPVDAAPPAHMPPFYCPSAVRVRTPYQSRDRRPRNPRGHGCERPHTPDPVCPSSSSWYSGRARIGPGISPTPLPYRVAPPSHKQLDAAGCEPVARRRELAPHRGARRILYPSLCDHLSRNTPSTVLRVPSS